MPSLDASVPPPAVSRHRTVMNLFDKSPGLPSSAFVAPSASVIGDVTVGEKSSVWYNTVLRGAWISSPARPGSHAFYSPDLRRPDGIGALAALRGGVGPPAPPWDVGAGALVRVRLLGLWAG